MFDLEREIRRWRRSMTARMPLRRESIQELESHLRDAMQERLKSESSPEAAWRSALAQLGAPDVIAAEYGKLPPCAVWRWRPARMVLLGYLLLCFGLCSLFFLAGGFEKDPLLVAHVLSLTFGYVTGFAVSAIAVWSVLSRAFRGWSQVETDVLQASTRGALAVGLGLTFVGVVLGSVWARFHLGQFWCWTRPELGGAAVLAWYALVLGLLAGRPGERLGFALGLSSSIVVAFGWFGSVAFTLIGAPQGPHFAIRAPFLMAFGVLPFLVLAWLPAGRLTLRKAG